MKQKMFGVVELLIFPIILINISESGYEMKIVVGSNFSCIYFKKLIQKLSKNLFTDAGFNQFWMLIIDKLDLIKMTLEDFLYELAILIIDIGDK